MNYWTISMEFEQSFCYLMLLGLFNSLFSGEVLGYPCVGDDADDFNNSAGPRLVTLPCVKRDEVLEFLLDVIPFPT
jgi:hypothetical protein